MKALIGAFNQGKGLVGAFSVIVQLHRLIVYSTAHHCSIGCILITSRPVCCLLLLPAPLLAQLCPQPADTVHVELVTGKVSSHWSTRLGPHLSLVEVFTAPEDILDSRPGTLMLTDCIDLCLSNSTCRAANFETGLCVLFSSSAQQYPGQESPNSLFISQSWTNLTCKIFKLISPF